LWIGLVIGFAHGLCLLIAGEHGGRWSAVVPLALEKRLFLNVRRKYLLVPVLGKKPCDINKRLDPF
jgi:hypothetical protein